MIGRFSGSRKLLGRLLVGRYQVVQVLGGGGFGLTYIAQDTLRPGHPKCVVKHLKPASNNPDFLQIARRLFTSEAETLERLSKHDQVPQLLAYFEENHEFYLVQEFIEGHPFTAELAPKHHWTEGEVVQLLQQVLGILEFTHSHGVIHRDIKPDNIIRRQRDDRLVLIDFGAVKQIQTQLTTAQVQSSTTVVIGTPGYMPMEQGHGKPCPNSDIYALGMIGIQVLTGLNPGQLEKDPNTGEILWQHQAQVSAGLASVLTKMVRSRYKDRYQSAREALGALEQLAARKHLVTDPGEVPAQLLSTSQPLVPSTPLPQTLSGETEVISDFPASGQPLDPMMPTLPQAESHPCSFLSPEQCSRLEEILVEVVGTIASTLLRQVSVQVSSLEELVEKLALYLHGHQKIEFEKKAKLFLQKSTVQSQTKSYNLPDLKKTAINEGFVRKCEEELADLIGPIASFLVQRAIKSRPPLSSAELVETLAAEIPDPQKSSKFQQRLLS